MKFDILFILDGHIPILCEDAIKWARWKENTPFEQMIVKKTWISGIEVSTVFTGLNTQPLFVDQPQVFVTDILDPDIEYHATASTWEEAEKDHELAVKFMKDKVQ